MFIHVAERLIMKGTSLCGRRIRDWSSEMDTIGFYITLSRGNVEGEGVTKDREGTVRCLRERVCKEGVAEAKVMGA